LSCKQRSWYCSWSCYFGLVLTNLTATQTHDKTHCTHCNSSLLLARVLACQELNALPTRWCLHRLLRMSICLSIRRYKSPHNMFARRALAIYRRSFSKFLGPSTAWPHWGGRCIIELSRRYDHSRRACRTDSCRAPPCRSPLW